MVLAVGLPCPVSGKALCRLWRDRLPASATLAEATTRVYHMAQCGCKNGWLQVLRGLRQVVRRKVVILQLRC